MEINRLTRVALNHLSKEVFGTESRWQKLVDKGYSELITEEVNETVPAEKEGDESTTRKIRVPVLNKFGAKQFVKKYHTVESVMEFMQAQQKQLAELKAKFLAMQEEQKKKKEEAELVNQIHNAGAGSIKS
jgi:hypothetical protein